MIDITTPNPPAEVFVVEREAIRAGRGLRTVRPTSWWINGGVVQGLHCKGGVFVCFLSNCYTDRNEAVRAAINMAEHEHELELERFRKVSGRLDASRAAAEKMGNPGVTNEQ